MSTAAFSILSQGISKKVTSPIFGEQHKGIAPGGPMDQFSFDIGNALLKNQPGSPALEFIIAPTISFEQDCYFAIIGARYDEIVLKQGGDAGERIDHATVYLAPKGSVLEFKNKATIGFRSYLCFRTTDSIRENPVGRSRSSLEDIYRWVDEKGLIRVIEGPEYDALDNKAVFTDTYWKITNDFSQMGFRLTTPDEIPKVNIQNMVSEAVADGTVQLTPKGPIVLLRYRQTVGGYPRIYNVISADIDRLGQYAPNQVLRFRKVTLEEAKDIARQKQEVLAAMT